MWGNIRNSISLMRICRGIRTNAVLRDVKPTNGSTSSARAGAGDITSGVDHRPTEWEKKILVWTKTYPNKEAIPGRISFDRMQTAMSRARIRIANYMMAAALMGCAYVIIQGKRHVAEVTKDSGAEHNELRRQITAEYRASLNDQSKK